MSIILGMHFGHDASIAVIRDGTIAAYIQRERLCRLKQAYSLDRLTLDHCLGVAGIQPRDIDLVTVTSTQSCEPLLAKLDGVEMRYEPRQEHQRPAPLVQAVGANDDGILGACTNSMFERVLGRPPDPKVDDKFQVYMAEYAALPWPQARRFPWFDLHYMHTLWSEPLPTSQLAATDIGPVLEDDNTLWGFHYPLAVTLDGVRIPGLRVDHHLSHAASTYYRSGMRRALVVTNDGYSGKRSPFSSGGIYWAEGESIRPLMPHHYTQGRLFEVVAMHLLDDSLGAAGKMMGLSSYGEPTYFDVRFVANDADWRIRGEGHLPEDWLMHARSAACERGDTFEPYPSADCPFNAYERNLAASTQRVFEECWLAIIHAADAMLERAGLAPEGLCISGGAALNCLSNSRCAAETGHGAFFVEPNCDDSGLAIGSALWACHTYLGEPLERSEPFAPSEVYVAGYGADSVEAALANAPAWVSYERMDDPASAGAADLAAGLVVGWYEGGGEMGPRALGHRSVLASPLERIMHAKVNAIKGREQWRPLAPAVLADRATEFFELDPGAHPHRFMLMTSRVVDQRLVAVTHIDGSARVQLVEPDTGGYARLIEVFGKITGVPVVMNTSMNNRGEPIVERPTEAIRFFLQSGLDVLYLDGWRLRRTG
jgi:carbamoyltransferase